MAKNERRKQSEEVRGGEECKRVLAIAKEKAYSELYEELKGNG